MTLAIELPVDLLQSALVCASKEDARYYLNGVYLDPTGWMIGLDGHRMFVGRCPAARALPEGIIIPREAVRLALAKTRQSTATLERLDGNRWTLFAGVAAQFFAPIDGTFPDWRRVVPSGPKAGPAHFNPDHYRDLGVIAKHVSNGNTDFLVEQDPGGPCPVTFAGRADCFVVLMPMRPRSAPAFDALTWLVDPTDEPEAAAA